MIYSEKLINSTQKPYISFKARKGKKSTIWGWGEGVNPLYTKKVAIYFPSSINNIWYAILFWDTKTYILINK